MVNIAGIVETAKLWCVYIAWLPVAIGAGNQSSSAQIETKGRKQGFGQAPSWWGFAVVWDLGTVLFGKTPSQHSRYRWVPFYANTLYSNSQLILKNHQACVPVFPVSNLMLFVKIRLNQKIFRLVLFVRIKQEAPVSRERAKFPNIMVFLGSSSQKASYCKLIYSLWAFFQHTWIPEKGQ